MDIILQWLSTAISTVGPFFILLGILIFVHELGHFLTAKYFGVRVETFSIGFGKKIFSYKRGDTTYCVSIIPLGGYVKMFGDDPSKEVAEDEKKYSFLHQPLIPRMLIVAAGPLVNLFFAIIVFALVAMLGEKLPSTIVGDVKANTQAYSAGFRSGDKITKINNKNMQTWVDISAAIKANAEKSIDINIARNGEEKSLSVTPKLGANDNIISFDEHVGVIDGLSIRSKAAVFGTHIGSLGKIPAVIFIDSINGTKVQFYRQVAEMLKQASGSDLTLSYIDYFDESNTAKTKTIKNWFVTPKASELEVLKALGIESSELYLANVKSSSPASTAGLKPGDKLLSINGAALSQWEDILNNVKSFDVNAKPLNLKVQRGQETFTTSIVPEMTELMTSRGVTEQRFTVGIIPAIVSALNDPVLIRTLNPLKATWIGVEKSKKWTWLTIASFVKLIQNKVSPKNIGGVISIGRVAQRSFEVGLSSFLKMMGIISINLFLLNLLPIPVLDGGHLVFFTLEALKGAPISLKKLEIAQTVGIVLLMTLMAFALFNDVSNLYSSLSW